MSATMTARAFKRQGLHRVECDCGAYTYSTVACLETHGLPMCGCGSRFLPGRVELAEVLGVVDCPAVVEYRAEFSSVLHGQASHGRRGRALRPAEAIAAERVERRRRDLARKRRVSAILPTPEPLPF
jgi:hypothetical protein